jgi:hypothetical protein
VFAFHPDLTLFKEFNHSSQAALECGFGKKYYIITRNLNYKFLTCTFRKSTIKLIFTQNPKSIGRKKRIRCTNIKTGKVQDFISVRKCAQSLNYK